MEMSNSICPGDVRKMLHAQRYRAMLVSMCKKTEKRKSSNMSQDSDNDLQNCDPSCKKQRVGSATKVTQSHVCSSDGVMSRHQPSSSLPKDVYNQELARSPQMDGSTISKEEEENVGSAEDRVHASRDQSPSVVQGSPKVPLPSMDLDSPRFREYWVPVQLSKIQLEQYCSTLLTNSGWLCSKKGNLIHLQEVLSALRKCCDHPYVLDSSLQSFCKERNPAVDFLNIGIQASGKLQLLSKFLPQIRKQGMRVLIVYKTATNSVKNSLEIGHILDDFICQSFGQESYVHIYTQRCVPPKEKQAAIDLFNDKTSGRFVVLTEYSSSLACIRLSSVDVVILFNSEWNPVNDIRALQKMTLQSQNDHLRVFRLYSACTLEEKALCLARDGAAVNSRYFSTATCYVLLAWGAAYLFDKVDALHTINASESTKSLGYELFCSILDELSTILSSDAVDDPRICCSVISKLNAVGEGYSGNVKLLGELEVQSLDDVPPYAFWCNLLHEKNPHWLFLPEEPETLKRRITPSERLADTSEGGFTETDLLHRELPGWSKGTSHNAKRSKRVPVSAASLQERLQKSKRGPECTRDVHNDISQHIQRVDETHKRRMQELLLVQQNEILEHMKTRNSRRQSLEKEYQSEKDLISELYTESLAKLNELKKLDEEYKVKKQALSHEMDKSWGILKTEQHSARTHEEEMRLKKIESLKKHNAGTVSEDSNGANIDTPFASTDSGNVNMSPVHSTLLEYISDINTLEDGEICTSPTIKSTPLSPVQELSPRESDDGLSHDVLISPDNLHMEDLVAISVDPDNTLEDGEICASPTELLNPVPPTQELSPRERDDGLSHDVAISPDKFQMEDLMAISVDPVNTLEDAEICASPIVLSRPVLPIQDSSPRESLNMNNENGWLHDVDISPAKLPMEDDNTLEDGEICASPTVITNQVPHIRESSPRESLNTAHDNGYSHDVEISSGNLPIYHPDSTMEDGEICASPNVISSPGLPIQELSPRERLTMVNDHDLSHNGEISPDNFTMKDLDIPMNRDNILEDGEICASTVLVSGPIPPIQESSPRERLNTRNDNGLLSPDFFPMEDLIVMSVDPDENIHTSTLPVILAEPVISGSSSVEQLDDPITSENPKLLHVCSTLLLSKNNSQREDQDLQVTESQDPIKRLEDATDEVVQSDVGNLTIEEVTSMNDQNQVSQGLFSGSVPITDIQERGQSITNGVLLHGDNEISHQSVPTNEMTVAELAADVLEKDQNHDPQNTISCSVPITESQITRNNNMQNSEPLNVPSNTVGAFHDSSCNETETIYVDSDDEQIHETSVVTPVGQLAGNSGVLPPQLPTAQPPLPSCQYFGNGACSQAIGPPTRLRSDAFLVQLHQAAQSQFTDTSSNYDSNSSRMSYVRPNSCQPARFDPLQVELEELKKAGSEAVKMRDDMVLQLGVSRDKEIAQINAKYAHLVENAKNDFEQKNRELKLRYEKTRAHKLLAEALKLAHDRESPIDQMFILSSLMQSPGLPLANGMQTNANHLSPQPMNQNRMQTNGYAISPQQMNQNSMQTNSYALSPQLMNQNSMQTNSYALSPQLMNQNSTQMNAYALSRQLMNQNGMQTNAYTLSPQMMNQFSNIVLTDQNVIPPSYPTLYNQLCNSEASLVPYGQNPHIFPSVPFCGPTLTQIERHPPNFCSSGSSSGPYSQPYSSEGI